MTNGGQVEQKIKISLDKRGADEAIAANDKVAASAERAHARASAATNQSVGAFGKLQSSIGLVRRALAGFGAVAIFTSVVAGVGKIIESFTNAKKKAEEFKKAQDELANNKLKELAEDYKHIGDALAKAASAEARTNQRIDDDIANRRAKDAASLDLAEQQALDELDPDDADYAEKAARIKADYASRRDKLKRSNAVEDVVIERQKLTGQADLKDREAENLEAQNENLEKQKDILKERRAEASSRSVGENEADATGFWSMWGKSIKDIVTLNWGNLGETNTEEGDKIREQAEAERKQLDEEIKSIEAQQEKNTAVAEEKRAEAGAIRYKADGLSTRLEAVNMANEASRREADRNEAQADDKLVKKRQQRSDAEAAKELLEDDLSHLKADRRKEERKKTEAAQSVFDAKGELELARLNKDGAGQKAAYEKLQQAQANANEVNAAADNAIAKIDETLKRIKQKLSQVGQILDKQQSQTFDSMTDLSGADSSD